MTPIIMRMPLGNIQTEFFFYEFFHPAFFGIGKCIHLSEIALFGL